MSIVKALTLHFVGQPGRWSVAGRLEEPGAMRSHQHTPREAARGAMILQEERQPRQTVLEDVWSSEMKDPETLFRYCLETDVRVACCSRQSERIRSFGSVLHLV